VVQEIEKDERFGPDETERARWLRTAGLEIHTTLRPQVQEASQTAVDKYVPRENESRKVSAQVVIEPGTGQILGMAQGRNYGPDESKLGETSINFATDADRGGSTGFQAGSTFKAITLAAALEEGMPFSTAFNSPTKVSVSGQRSCNGGYLATWEPSNAGDTASGTTHNMVSGTKASSNTYFAQLQRRVGLCATAEMAERTGGHRADGEPLGVWSSFTLGDQEVSPLTVANAYATFASRGVYCEPRPVSSVTIGREGDEDFREIRMRSHCDEDAVPAHVADGVNHLLQQTFKGGTANGLGIGRPAAGKTGTTDNAAYAWFAGHTPNLASAVVVGDIRGGEKNPLQGVWIGGRYYGIVYGGTLPGPIWQATMSRATSDLPAESFAPSPSRYGDPSAPPPKKKEEDDDA
jgi:membrane peptidoglycan carboxypeptidase